MRLLFIFHIFIYFSLSWCSFDFIYLYYLKQAKIVFQLVLYDTNSPSVISKERINDRCKEVSLHDVLVVVFVFDRDNFPHESERAEN